MFPAWPFLKLFLGNLKTTSFAKQNQRMHDSAPGLILQMWHTTQHGTAHQLSEAVLKIAHCITQTPQSGQFSFRDLFILDFLALSDRKLLFEAVSWKEALLHNKYCPGDVLGN